MRIIFLADMHVGSRVGLANPDETGKHEPGKPVHEKLFSLWTNLTNEYRGADALVAVGDLVDGQGKKSGGTEQWTTDLETQAHHAAELIEMWNARRIFVIRGSPYHVTSGGTGIQVEESVARKLGAEVYPHQEHLPEDRRDRSGWHWYLTFGKVTFHVAHKIGISRVFHYRSTPIARQMLNVKLNDGMRHQYECLARKVTPDNALQLMRDATTIFRTRVVVRAHGHYFWQVGSAGGSAGYNLPCWQALTPYMEISGAVDISPTIGVVIFEIEGGRCHAQPIVWRVEDVQPAPHTTVELQHTAAENNSFAIVQDMAGN